MIHINEEAARCLLCYKAPCTQNCPQGLDPGRAVRAVRFDDAVRAGAFVDQAVCAGCKGACQDACVQYDTPVRIKQIISQLPLVNFHKISSQEPDLSIDFMGVHCENPFFLSSSIVAGNYEMCAKALNMGWAGVVYKTIGFIKPEEVSPRFDAIRKEGTPFIGFKNLEQISDHELSENLEILRKLKENFPSKVIVASIMGQSDKEWAELAEMACKAGVDMIECNFSCPHMSAEGLGSDVGQNPELVARYTELVKSRSTVPVLAKMTPNIGHMEIPAVAAVKAGADGLAAINTVKCITGIDVERMASQMCVGGFSSVSGYSGKAVKPIALRFIHDMVKCPALKDIPISGMGGIETWKDALEFIALGCSNVQVTTAVMEYGYRIIDDLKAGLAGYMSRKGITSVSQLVGAALDSFVSPLELDRHSIVYPSFSSEKCRGCGRCYISCMDAGHQAIAWDEENRRPKLSGGKCVGCHLCLLVCPAEAIGTTKRVEKIKK